jgi:putative ABC transport system permease protein
LILAKFARKSAEIGVRRALGASRKQIFAQHLIEAGIIGVSGGVLGVILTALGLWLVRSLYSAYANVAAMSTSTLLATIGVSILASVFAGLYPTWRASCVEPAIQVKVQ